MIWMIIFWAVMKTILVITVILTARYVWLNSNIVFVIEVNKKMFSKLQSIYEFREDMQKGLIANSPVINNEQVITGILLTVMKKRKDVFLLKKKIKFFQNEIDNSIDKYL